MSVFRKNKSGSADMQASLAKFTDMSKDCVSRVKHLKLLLDGLSVVEKRQLIDEHSFETFHLVDELLLCTELDSNSPAALEAESGLWALEQVLCFAPELVGSGWQQHAIESLLKKALYPKNVLAVRKIAIRLFLIFYQSLGVCNKNMPHLDRVFQCLLPHFPLADGSNTEAVMAEYCQSASTPSAGQLTAVHHISISDGVSAPSAKERAQLLQIYLDKFLEYCTRECSRIEWNDENKKLECAKFIISKVIDLYIMESFPDLEVNGVDVFGGWEGEGQTAMALDTADPVVIARYWLIRWMNNIAGARLTAGPGQHPGLKLFHQALFSSHKATNVMLTLLREAMTLPLPCSNVMHKVVTVLSAWLLQTEIPPFVESGQVPMETFALLVTHTLLAFFHSPYLQQTADRLPSALSLSFVILRHIRQLATQRMHLPMPITNRVWSELIGHLCAAAKQVLSSNDAYSQQVSGPFINTLLTLLVVVKAVRRVPVDERLWDDVFALFDSRPTPQLVEQWAIVNRSVTRALILHLTHIEIFPKEELDKCMNDHETNKSLAERQSNTEKPDEEVETTLLPALQFDDITHAVPSWSGDPLVWLGVWRRLVCLCPVATPLVAETLSHTIQALLMVSLIPLAHWLAARLLTLPPPLLAQAIPALSSVCQSARQTDTARILHAHILSAMGQLVQTKDDSVLEQICLLHPSELNVLRKSLLSALPNLPPSIYSIRLAYALASDPTAIQYLHNQLNSNLSLPLSLATTNALTMLLIQKADVKEINPLLTAILPHQHASSLLLILLTSLLSLCRFGCQTAVLQAFLRVSSMVKDARLKIEIQWLLCSLCLSHLHIHLPVVTQEILKDRQKVLQGMLVSMGGQFPLPNFDVTRWNSLEAGELANDKTTFIKKTNAMISVRKEEGWDVTCRTVVGKHTWSMREVNAERQHNRHVNAWLEKQAAKGKRAGREASGICGAMEDPFDALPELPAPRQTLADDSEWMRIVTQSRRQPQPVKSVPKESHLDMKRPLEWRSLAANLGFVPAVCAVPSAFSRDLKHLDQTKTREVHKVAVIYVGEGQEDKQTILANTHGSLQFEGFVDQLGWPVKIGPTHHGYSGGLPINTMAPYYATAHTELIFHVSTRLGGDCTNKWKHIGNDEVHVVWCEGGKQYKRETMATKFCDVLIVLEKTDSQMYRVRIDTASSLEFGPLFDGALVGEAELAEAVRLTALNASRAYRLSSDQSMRPLQHREDVFSKETLSQTQAVPLSMAIHSLFIPCM